MQENNVVGWFEIPVEDMERAVKFYEKVFGFKLERNKLGPLDMAIFPQIPGGKGTAGSLVHHVEHYKPSAEGTVIYFTSPSGDVKNELEKVVKAGGKMIRPKTQISEELGYMGIFLDSEGNRIAVHSRFG